MSRSREPVKIKQLKQWILTDPFRVALERHGNDCESSRSREAVTSFSLPFGDSKGRFLVLGITRTDTRFLVPQEYPACGKLLQNIVDKH